MSNYTQLTLFTPKDSLTNGDPNKVIKGATIDPELSAIATAIATKLDTPVTNVTVVSTANSVAETINANSTNNQSFGLLINGGTSAVDYPLKLVTNGNVVYLFAGNGHMYVNNNDMTPFYGTTTLQFTGAVASPQNCPVLWIQQGFKVSLMFNRVSSAAAGSPGNALTTIGGLPNAIRPILSTSTSDLSLMFNAPMNVITNSAVATGGFVAIGSDGVCHVTYPPGFANTNNAGFPPFSVTYQLTSISP